MTELQISNVAELEEQDETLYSYEQFNKLWESLDPESVEKSALVRRANTCVKEHESGVQYNAQYGRMLPGSTDMIFQILQLQRDDLFLDVGHGIGNACLQAAYTVGCEARGIEVVKDRYDIGLRFQEALEELAYQQDVIDGKVRANGAKTTESWSQFVLRTFTYSFRIATLISVIISCTCLKCGQSTLCVCIDEINGQSEISTWGLIRSTSSQLAR